MKKVVETVLPSSDGEDGEEDMTFSIEFEEGGTKTVFKSF